MNLVKICQERHKILCNCSLITLIQIIWQSAGVVRIYLKHHRLCQADDFSVLNTTGTWMAAWNLEGSIVTRIATLASQDASHQLWSLHVSDSFDCFCLHPRTCSATCSIMQLFFRQRTNFAIQMQSSLPLSKFITS